MTIIVEDGTGLSTAETYIAVAAADTYHAERGNIAWGALDQLDDKEPALRRATDYMRQVYRNRWKGTPVSNTQALDWPRYSVFPDNALLYSLPSDAVPTEVKNACAELALRATTTELLADVAPTGAVRSETVGPISVSYDNTGQRSMRYVAIDKMLGPLLLVGGSGIQGVARLG